MFIISFSSLILTDEDANDTCMDAVSKASINSHMQ